MAYVEPHGTAWVAENERRRSRALTVGLLTVCAVFVVLWPYTSVIAAGPWSFVCACVVFVVALTGVLMRQLRLGPTARSLWTLFAQVLVAIGALTLLLVPQGAILGVVPTGSTVTALGRLLIEGFQQVQVSVAPMDDTLALRSILGIGIAIVTILLDHLIAQRLTLLAVLFTAAVGAVPMIVTFGDANVVWFVMLAMVSLFLLRHGIRHDHRNPRRASAGVAVGVGATATIVALVLTPILPVSATWMGAGTSLTLNPSLRLGDDLRRPAPTDVITIATSDTPAPYLRIATLSRFDGRVWTADETPAQPLSDGFGEADWSEAIDADPRRTSIRINGISSSWLPVPYPATQIVGASSAWNVMPANRTVISETQNAAGADYTVTSVDVAPTLEQIRAADAVADAAPEEPVPDVVAETAAEVTADADTDYDRLVALQNWFRSQFTYSLEAPVEGDFDGTGSEAVEAFLEARSGYCIHFAGAFALMAQSLDMPVRIVVGYLPGRLTDDTRGDDSVYVVSSDQLHAWPEVRFDGIGWVPFEPTASLGVPTLFQAAETDTGGTTPPTEPTPSAAPTTAATSGPEIDRDQGDTSTADGQSLQPLDPTPVMLVTFAVLLVIVLPALIRLAMRMRRYHRARAGDAVMAWNELRETLIDLRLPVSDADTPRERGAELVKRGADAGAVHVLVGAIEQASYARTVEKDADLAGALRRVSDDLRHSVDMPARLAAVFVPRSLFTTSSASVTAS
ncbi:DUF3488 and transglutaminase-like domain-containing protein [Microbacterium sp.]|uniref:transglutaminase family protein n=1 Tax=Microbacterium sp. TaxID=51671 RepID=UPI0026237551|nr:DUF3488 and transglutaminase-like domain-containing protein [Microbacterium sp.]